MKRGDLYWVNLEPSSPPEFGKVRPSIIVSNTEQNLILNTIVVLPISSQGEEIWPLRLEIKIKSLSKKSFAIIPGIRQIAKSRITKFIGSTSFATQNDLSRALEAYLID